MNQRSLIDRRPGPGPAVPDLTSMWRDAATGWFDAVDAWMDAAVAERPAPLSNQCRCGCDCAGDCGPECRCDGSCGCRSCCLDDCHCRCCITDADLLVQAKVGEVRVIPIRIENPRRRERQVSLELSDFSAGRGGDEVHVEGKIVSDGSFVIEPCGDHIASLVVAVRHADGGSTEQPGTPGRGDVEECVVAYADLRVEGCDIRPVRIAVAVLPRDCDTYDVGCGCGCC